jgi:hypothetical protein
MVIEYVVFEGKLHAYNRWVKLSKIIPWEHIELDYADLLPCCQERGMALHTYEL